MFASWQSFIWGLGSSSVRCSILNVQLLVVFERCSEPVGQHHCSVLD